MEFLKPGSKMGGESGIWLTEPLKREYKSNKIKKRFFCFFLKLANVLPQIYCVVLYLNDKNTL